jgi:hypothetical protein
MYAGTNAELMPSSRISELFPALFLANFHFGVISASSQVSALDLNRRHAFLTPQLHS